MNKTIEVIVEEKENCLMLKAVLSKSVGLSRREISRLKFNEGILLNGESCRVTEIVHTGDKITLTFPEKDLPHVLRMCGKPDILYEDEDIVIVDKPAGMVCHPTHEHIDDDMGTLLQNYYGSGFMIRAIGRLDKEVSGIMVYAKNQITASRLSKQRQQDQFHKVYHALAQGVFKEKHGTLHYNLDRIEGTKQRKIVEDGKACITHFSVMKQYATYALLSISIETGRTHQIRAGMSSIGHPLLGDTLYGGNRDLIDRPALHCAVVDFIQPFTKKEIHVELHEPSDMQKLISR